MNQQLIARLQTTSLRTWRQSQQSGAAQYRPKGDRPSSVPAPEPVWRFRPGKQRPKPIKAGSSLLDVFFVFGRPVEGPADGLYRPTDIMMCDI
jgi:hypothetical protein